MPSEMPMTRLTICTGRRAAVFLLALLVLLAPASWAGRRLDLTLLHTNDVHGHMLPYDYGDQPNVGGAARRATLVDRIRRETHHPLLLVDSGDVITIPKTPSFVLVSGQVYDAAALTCTPGKNAGWYLRQAGGPHRALRCRWLLPGVEARSSTRGRQPPGLRRWVAWKRTPVVVRSMTPARTSCSKGRKGAS